MRECRRELCFTSSSIGSAGFSPWVSTVRPTGEITFGNGNPQAEARATWASSARGYVAVWMAALEEMPQAVAGLFEGVVKIVNSPDSVGQFSRVEIGNQFVAQVRGAADAAGHERGNDLAVVPALQLILP